MKGVKDQLQIRAKGRQIVEEEDECCLREPQAYVPDFEGKDGTFRSQNLHFWNIYLEDADG